MVARRRALAAPAQRPLRLRGDRRGRRLDRRDRQGGEEDRGEHSDRDGGRPWRLEREPDALRGRKISVAYDWDSLRVDKETTFVGHAATHFPYTERFDVSAAPSPEEARLFVEEYEAARRATLSRRERAVLFTAATYGLLLHGSLRARRRPERELVSWEPPRGFGFHGRGIPSFLDGELQRRPSWEVQPQPTDLAIEALHISVPPVGTAWATRLRALEDERQPLQSAQEQSPAPAKVFRRHRQARLGEAPQERADGDLPLHPGERRPQAVMYAAPPEGEVPVGVAREVEDVGVLEVPPVAVGRAEHRQDQLTARYRRPRDLHVLARVALGRHLHGRGVAQELLDRRLRE